MKKFANLTLLFLIGLIAKVKNYPVAKEQSLPDNDGVPGHYLIVLTRLPKLTSLETLKVLNSKRVTSSASAKKMLRKPVENLNVHGLTNKETSWERPSRWWTSTRKGTTFQVTHLVRIDKDKDGKRNKRLQENPLKTCNLNVLLGWMNKETNSKTLKMVNTQIMKVTIPSQDFGSYRQR